MKAEFSGIVTKAMINSEKVQATDKFNHVSIFLKLKLDTLEMKI
jgi:hypothetical protein